MSTYSKRVKITPNVLLEYTFDDNNFKSEDYQVLTNLKEKTKSYMSETTINNAENSLFLVDPVLSKYSPISTTNFNFLRIQDYFTSPVVNDRLTIYFPSGFDFVSSGYLGFYINVYTYGYDNNTKYSLSNFYYVVSNIDSIKLFDLPNPFYYDEKYWVKAIQLEFPSVNAVSENRIVSSNINVPKPDSINENLTYGEGLSVNLPIFVDFTYISSSNEVLGVKYYYTSELFSASVPQTPEFTELGVNVTESTQGDYFEVYATYLGSNENMDEFRDKQQVQGIQIRLEYLINLYEENIITSTQTFVVTENFTQKILYRPVIQFSNTTAAIDVELKIVNLVDNSYISKFGSLGITNSINKYGLKLSRLNVDKGVINAEIFNLKVKNTMIGGSVDNFVDVMKVPYPVLVDRYRILTKTTNASTQTNDYIPNGMLEILITSFDNIIEFNIAQDINSNGEPIPYDLSVLSTNSNLKLVFKSDSEKLEKDPFFEADNNYEIGNISFKIQEKDYKLIRRIYDKGYDNFYLVVVANNNTTTQLYSGKFVFYEDVTFVGPSTVSTTGTTSVVATSDKSVTNTENADSVNNGTIVDKRITQNNPFVSDNMPSYLEDPTSDKNYTNLLIYVRFQTNIDKMDAYLKLLGITPEIKYGNMYFLKRIYATTVVDIKSQDFIEKIFEIPLTSGMAPKEVKSYSDVNSNLRVYVTPPEDPTKPKTQPYTPPKPGIYTSK
jgi:hypothetical protein